MKRIVIGLALVLAAAPALFGCDEDKKKEQLLAKTADSASAAASVAPQPKAAPPASATPEPAKPIVCPEGAEITIADSDLEGDIRVKLSKPKGAITKADLARVRSVNLTRKASLDALDPCIFPKLTGLHHLYLGPGKYRDLKPIANLVQLESLRASINEVEDLTPLEKLTQLDRLDLGRTHVRDLAPLANLVNLTELQLDDTEVSDVTPLAKLKKLEKLSIKHTNVTSVGALRGLEKLKFLYVEGCALGDLDALAPLVARGLHVVTS